MIAQTTFLDNTKSNWAKSSINQQIIDGLKVSTDKKGIATIYLNNEGGGYFQRIVEDPSSKKGYSYKCAFGEAQIFTPNIPPSIRLLFSTSPISGAFWAWVQENKDLPIIITEGAKKAFSAISRGFVAIALAGNGHLQAASVVKKLAPYLADRQIYIALDMDTDAGLSEESLRYIHQANNLPEWQSASAINVLLWDKQEGKGLDDFLANGGDLDALISASVTIGQLPKPKKVAMAPTLFVAPSTFPLERFISKEHRDLLANGCNDGGRDNNGIALCCDLIGAYNWLLARNYTPESDPLTLISDYCNRCSPPLSDQDAVRLFKSAESRNPTPCLSEDKLIACLGSVMSPKTSSKEYKATAKPLNDDEIQYEVNLVHLANDWVKDAIHGIGKIKHTVASLIAIYKELKGWENVVDVISDIKLVGNALEITSKMAKKWHCKGLTEALNNLVDFHNLRPSLAESTELNAVNDRLTIYKLTKFPPIPAVADLDEAKRLQAERDQELKDEKAALKSRVISQLGEDLTFNLEVKEWYRYQNGYWKAIHADVVERLVRIALTDLNITDRQLYGKAVQIKDIREVVALLKVGSLTEKLSHQSKYPHMINLRDGAYDTIEKKLLPHSRDYSFTYQLPYRWADRSNGCDAILDWLKFALNDDKNAIKLLLCYLNAVVTGRTDAQKFLQLVGEGGAGKSTFANIAQALVGSENYWATTLELLESDKFESANFYGKHLVVVSEVGYTNNLGKFQNLKRLTGGDSIRHERKNIQATSTFAFKGKVIIVGNEPIDPTASEGGNAWNRRAINVPFTKIIEENQREDLLTIDGDEIRGKFKECMPALLELVLNLDPNEVKTYLNNAKSLSPTLAGFERQVMIQRDPIAAWLEQNCVIEMGAKTQIGKAQTINISSEKDGVRIARSITELADVQLYANYSEWCRNQGHKPVANAKFSSGILEISKRFNLGLERKRLAGGVHIINLAIRKVHDIDTPTPILKELTCEEVSNSHDLPKDSIVTVQGEEGTFKLLCYDQAEAILLDANYKTIRANRSKIALYVDNKPIEKGDTVEVVALPPINTVSHFQSRSFTVGSQWVVKEFFDMIPELSHGSLIWVSLTSSSITGSVEIPFSNEWIRKA